MVPISPFPEPEDVIQTVEWSEDDAEEIEDMEQQAENQDIEKLVIAKHPHEVELDETMFHEVELDETMFSDCLLYTSPSPRDA